MIYAMEEVTRGNIEEKICGTGLEENEHE